MEIEEMMVKLAELKTEYRANKKEFERKNKNLLDTIKSLENIITDEVLKQKQTIVVGNIKAEYVPAVKIRLKKVNDGE